MYCCECQKDVGAKLITGKEVYPSRSDLWGLPFWLCIECNNFVGCHHKTKNRDHPLGHIPTKEMKKARIHIHALIDPFWQSGFIKRRELYKKISDVMGWNFHTSKTKTIEECRSAYRVGLQIKKELGL